MPRLFTNLSDNTLLTKKELAAQELEARRLSLVRRPSVPAIPHPDELGGMRPGFFDDQALTLGQHHGSFGMPIPSERQLMRSMSVDPELMIRTTGTTSGISTASMPIGLPATPRAMRHPKYMAGSPEDAPAVPDIPSSFMQMASGSAIVSAEPSPEEPMPMLLPATTFNPLRSASAPAEKFFGNYMPPPPPPEPTEYRPAQQQRKLSSDYQAIHPPTGSVPVLHSPGFASIEEALASAQQLAQNIIVVEASPSAPSAPPAILPELQHLAGPPPPPPPPIVLRGHGLSNSVGTIDPADMRHPTPAAMVRAPTPEFTIQPPPSINASPQSHRRGRGSMSETVGMKFRSVTTKLRERSTSRNRARSPPQQQPQMFSSAPYESIPPPPLMAMQRRGSKSTATSPPLDKGAFIAPYESTYLAAGPAAPADSAVASPSELAMAQASAYGGYRNPKDIAKQMTADQVQFGSEAMQDSKSGTPYVGYRNPKEIRANMPPTYTQAGAVYGEGEKK